MTETLEQIAIRIAEDIPEFLWTEGCAFESGIVEAQIIEFSKRLIKELGAQEPIGKVGQMPGTSGFTMAAFEASKTPAGINLYAAPRIEP